MTTPVPDRWARSHITAVYVQEDGTLALYCRKCAETLGRYRTIMDLRDLEEVAREHRIEKRKRQP